MSAMDTIIEFDYVLFIACIVIACIIFIKKLGTWLDSRN